MLTQATIEKLKELKLEGMARGLEDQLHTQDVESLSFLERLGLLLDREETSRANKRLATRLKQAKLKVQASLEDIDYRSRKGLEKGSVLSLASCKWIRDARNLIITGPTGIGKTYLACAFAHQACREGLRVSYHRLPRLLGELELARGDGRYRKLLAGLVRDRLIVLDDWGVTPLAAKQVRDILEILDDRYGAGATLITSQLPIDKWHAYLNEPTLADAILDRVIHNAYKLNLEGDSLRKRKETELTDLTRPQTS